MISPPPRNNTFAWVTGSPRIWLVSFWEVCGVIRFWNQTMNISNQEPWGCGRFAGNYGTNPKPMTSLTALNEGYTLQVMSTPSSYPLPRSWLMIKKWWCWWSRDSMFPPFPRGGCPISGKWRMMARGFAWSKARKLRAQGRYFVLPCFMVKMVPIRWSKTNIYLYM